SVRDWILVSLVMWLVPPDRSDGGDPPAKEECGKIEGEDERQEHQRDAPLPFVRVTQPGDDAAVQLERERLGTLVDHGGRAEVDVLRDDRADDDHGRRL